MMTHCDNITQGIENAFTLDTKKNYDVEISFKRGIDGEICGTMKFKVVTNSNKNGMVTNYGNTGCIVPSITQMTWVNMKSIYPQRPENDGVGWFTDDMHQYVQFAGRALQIPFANVPYMTRIAVASITEQTSRRRRRR